MKKKGTMEELALNTGCKFLMNFSSFSFIFIGDTHGFLNDFIKQKEIIEQVNPEFVLAEQLQDIVLDSKKSFLEIVDKRYISELVDFEHVEQLIKLCDKKNIKLVGMDIKDFGYEKGIRNIILGKRKPTKEEEKAVEKIVEKREMHQLRAIQKYAKMTKKPIVIITGCWHLREDSSILKSLDRYLVVYPSDGNGNLITEKPKDITKITYRNLVKNGTIRQA